MSDVPTITDRQSLQAWLETRPPEDAVLVAHRAAMRAVPIWITAMSEAWARERELTPIVLLRLNLTAGVARAYPTGEVGAAATRAADSAHAAISAVARATHFATAAGAAYGAIESAAATIRVAASSDSAAARAAAAAEFGIRAAAVYPDSRPADLAASRAAVAVAAMFRTTVMIDARDLIEGRDLLASALWPTVAPLSEVWSQSIPILNDTPGGDFWIDWYQRALDGRAQNWPLLRDVALIDDALWKQGGDALDLEISRIVERHDLLEEVRRLKAALSEAASGGAVISHRWHNGPPERLSDDADRAAAAAQSLGKQIDRAERELQKPRPSSSRLRAIGRFLKQAVTSVVRYSAGLGDEALQGAAKEIGASCGKWAGPAAVAWILSQEPAIQRLAEALLRFADRLS